jgi:hypothetical protein
MSLPTYIVGQDPNHERYFVTRTESPCFIGELVEPDEADGGLIFEDGEGFRIRQWLDAPRPAVSIAPLLGEIFEAVNHHADLRGK